MAENAQCLLSSPDLVTMFVWAHFNRNPTGPMMSRLGRVLILPSFLLPSSAFLHQSPSLRKI